MPNKVENYYNINLNDEDLDLLIQGIFGQHVNDKCIIDTLEHDFDTYLSNSEKKKKKLLLENPLFKIKHYNKNTKKNTKKYNKKKTKTIKK